MTEQQIFWTVLLGINSFTLGLQVARVAGERRVTKIDMLWLGALSALIAFCSWNLAVSA